MNEHSNISPESAPVIVSGRVGAIRHELEQLRSEWWWFLILGVGLVVLGSAAIGSGLGTLYTTYITVVLFGIFMLIGGIGQIVTAFWAGRWSGFALSLLIGILYVVTGFIMIDKPDAGATVLTLVLAAELFVSGLFRIIAAMTLRFTHWGWALLSGAVSLVLGIMIYKQLPEAALWVIGLFVGIEMIFNGWSWVMLGLSLRALPKASA